MPLQELWTSLFTASNNSSGAMMNDELEIHQNATESNMTPRTRASNAIMTRKNAQIDESSIVSSTNNNNKDMKMMQSMGTETQQHESVMTNSIIESASSSSLPSSTSTPNSNCDVMMMMRTPDANECVLSRDYHEVAVLRSTLQGAVRRMIHIPSGREVAVKHSWKKLVVSGRSATGVRIAEDVVTEAQLLHWLGGARHPHIVNLLAYEEDAQKHCLVMEMASHGELFDYIDALGPLPLIAAQQVFAQLTDGVKFLHNHHVCHLDLSLENVLLARAPSRTPQSNCNMNASNEYHAKICDFGLARMFQVGIKFVGSSRQRPGKLSYMSPEIYAGKDFDGAAADIWSLAIVLFTMLFGFPPFEVAARTDPRYVFMRKRGLRALLAEWNLDKQVPKSVIELLSSMLMPSDRRPNIAKVCAHEWVRSIISTTTSST